MQWIYNQRTRQWEVAVGGWRAVVLRMDDDSDDARVDEQPVTQWFGFVERRDAPHERRESPSVPWAHEARIWCEGELARLGQIVDGR